MFSHFGTITAYNRQVDRQTDRRVDTQPQRMHPIALRGKKQHVLSLFYRHTQLRTATPKLVLCMNFWQNHKKISKHLCVGWPVTTCDGLYILCVWCHSTASTSEVHIEVTSADNDAASFTDEGSVTQSVEIYQRPPAAESPTTSAETQTPEEPSVDTSTNKRLKKIGKYSTRHITLYLYAPEWKKRNSLHVPKLLLVAKEIMTM